MPSFANIVISGHLGGDPETRDAGNSTVTNFTVAVNTGFGDRECLTWYRVSVWGKRGITAAENLTKGSAVIINGEPQNRKYNKPDGSEHYSLEINNANWTFAGGKSEAGQSRPAATPSAEGTDFEDDIPF